MTLKEDASFFESNHCAVTVGQLKASPILTELAVVFWFLLVFGFGWLLRVSGYFYFLVSDGFWFLLVSGLC